MRSLPSSAVSILASAPPTALHNGLHTASAPSALTVAVVVGAAAGDGPGTPRQSAFSAALGAALSLQRLPPGVIGRGWVLHRVDAPIPSAELFPEEAYRAKGPFAGLASGWLSGELPTRPSAIQHAPKPALRCSHARTLVRTSAAGSWASALPNVYETKAWP